MHGEWSREVGAGDKRYVILECRDILDLQPSA
jgi:hypothetical protein